MAPDPSADIALVICSDRGLFWQGAFLLSRAAMLDPGQRMDLYYYVTEPMPAPLRAALPPRVKVVHWEGALPSASYGMPAHLTRAALLRIFAIDALAAQYPRVLYTDIDVFQRWGNLADLAELPPFDAPLAAVRDRALWGPSPERWVARNYLPRFAEPVRNRYFNSGVLLANGPAWRAEEVSARAMDFLAAHPEVCHYGDQSALNATLAGRWLELSPGWNWQANMRYDFLIPARNPRLVHFTGPIKPWADKWQRFDELYAAAMRDWLQMHGFAAELAAMSARGFRASMERRRTVEFTRLGWDPLETREAVKPYLNRRDFGDVVAGIRGYGWTDDRGAARDTAEETEDASPNRPG